MKNKSAFFYSSMVIGVLLFVLSLFYVYSSYQSDRSYIVDRLNFNASFVELWLTKSFSDSAFVLHDMVDDVSKRGPHRYEDNYFEHQSELFYLREKEDALPNAILAFIIDKNCILTHSATLKNIDVSHREYCKELRDNKDKETVVTLPFTDLAERNVVVQGHKIRDDNGDFAGMVGISTNLSFFNSTLQHLDLPSSMSIAIVSYDLKLLSAIPKGKGVIGNSINISSVPDSILETFHNDSEVAFTADVYHDGVVDTIYARKIEGLPFIVIVTKQQDFWQTVLSLSLLGVVSCFFVITGLLIFNSRYLKRTKAQKEKYSELAYNDYLTGVKNRRAFEIEAEKALACYRKTNQPFSLIMCDIDNFKAYNDRYGHEVGDIMLTSFSKICLDNLRECDVLGRFGGDEFIILISNQKTEYALSVAEKLQQEVRNLVVSSNNMKLTMTCSMGICEAVDPNTSFQELLNLADIQLYEAKKAGRNCVNC